MDIMSVNGLRFFITISEAINLVMAEYLPSMTPHNLQKAKLCVILLYKFCGFAPNIRMIGQQYDELGGTFSKFSLNMITADDHVPKVEHKIGIVNERFQVIMSTLPLQCLPV